jgi:site-specific recombinase XerD
LITDTLDHLEKLQYASGSIRHYRCAWNSLRRFAENAGLPDKFSEDLAEKFLASRGVPLAGPGRTTYAPLLRTAMRILSEFDRSGGFQLRQFTPGRIPLSAAMSSALKEYQTYCTTRLRASRGTIQVRSMALTLLLHYVQARGVTAPGEIQASDISGFIRSRGYLEMATIAKDTSALRSFFRIGFVLGFLPRDISADVPRVRVRRHGRLPSVWRSEDVVAVLRAVDRASPVGKRDFAMLLLASSLGMRVGDIRTLKLDDIDWHRASLSFRQGKTGKTLELPLDDEVANALVDYIRHGRPPTAYRELFLRANAPFVPFGPDDNLHFLLAKYRRQAGVKLPVQSRRGFHCLRHTVASRMLATGVPLEVISNVLGHQSLDTTRVYTSVDIDALRTVALDPEDGNYA